MVRVNEVHTTRRARTHASRKSAEIMSTLQSSTCTAYLIPYTCDQAPVNLAFEAYIRLLQSGPVVQMGGLVSAPPVFGNYISCQGSEASPRNGPLQTMQMRAHHVTPDPFCWLVEQTTGGAGDKSIARAHCQPETSRIQRHNNNSSICCVMRWHNNYSTQIFPVGVGPHSANNGTKAVWNGTGRGAIVRRNVRERATAPADLGVRGSAAATGRIAAWTQRARLARHID